VETRRNHALATIGPGELMGEMALFGRAPSSTTVTALTPMVTLIAGPESFGTLLTHPAMLRRLSTTLARRVRALQERVGDWRDDGLPSMRATHSASTSNGTRRYAPQWP
jgi:CRP-like cAMP-binding protein